MSRIKLIIASLKRQHGINPNYTLMRLKRDRPDLAERVVAGEMSADSVDLDQRSPRQTGAPRERRPPLPAPPRSERAMVPGPARSCADTRGGGPGLQQERPWKKTHP